MESLNYVFPAYKIRLEIYTKLFISIQNRNFLTRTLNLCDANVLQAR